MAGQYTEGIGRRKESSARVRLSSGTGIFTINDKPVEQFFNRTGDYEAIVAPLMAAGMQQADCDITVKVAGGGVSGQTGAVQLGLARAIIKLNNELVPTMRQGGFLTRDPRVKERKKPGLKRARKAPTYTKR